MNWSFASLDGDRRKVPIDIEWIVLVVVVCASALIACTADLVPEDKPSDSRRSVDEGPVVPWRTDDIDITDEPEDDPNATTLRDEGDAAAGLLDSDDAGSEPQVRGREREHSDAGSATLSDAAVALPSSPESDGGPGNNPRAANPPAPRGRPVATVTGDSCIPAIEAGERTYVCGSLSYLVQIDARCLNAGCGLIVNAHANMMSARQMRDATQLHVLGANAGYLVVHPSPMSPENAGGWEASQYAQVLDFIQRMQRVFEVDPKRVHMSGFGSGADLALWFACAHPELLASVAAISSISHSAECFTPQWQPPVPLLYAHGALDAVSSIEEARAMVDSIVAQLSLTGGERVGGDALWLQEHWTGGSGMVLDFIEHQYARSVFGGFCIPGAMDPAEGSDADVVAVSWGCSTPVSGMSWGQAALDWFIAHPRL